MKKNKLLSVVLAVLIVSTLVSACSGKGNDTASPSPSSSVSDAGSSASPTGSSPQAADPFGKYEPSIKMTTVKQIFPWLIYPEGDSIDNNVWLREYRDVLGIDVDYMWTVPEDQYLNKLNASIASGDIPDVMVVDESQFKTLLDSNMIEDLTEAYNKYASDELKSLVFGSEFGQANLKIGDVDGKLMGLPLPMVHPAETTNVLYIRTDWLKNLGLSEPKSMQDLLEIIRAYKEDDPDGNKKDDTFGLAVAKNVAPVYPEGIGDLIGFFNGFGAYPGLWVDDSNGGLVNGSILPEMKAALQTLQDLYKSGMIDKEFAVKDRWKVGEEVGQGKFGVLYGVNWTTINPLANTIEKDPKADWKAFPLLSDNGKPALAQGKPINAGYYVVRKGYDHPEAVIKMANLSADRLVGKSAQADPSSLYKYGMSQDAKYQYHHYRVVNEVPGDKNLTSTWLMTDALKAKDPSKLTPEQKNQYDNILKYMNGEISKDTFIAYKLQQASEVFAITYYRDKQLLSDKFTGRSTPAMIDKSQVLGDLAIERFTQMIMGAPIEEYFEKFVSDWKKLGGDEITAEVNAWYKAQ